MPTAYDRWKLMTPEQDARVRGCEDRDDLYEYELHIEACAEEMGVSKREFIDHMDREYYMATVQPVELDEETENFTRR